MARLHCPLSAYSFGIGDSYGEGQSDPLYAGPCPVHSFQLLHQYHDLSLSAFLFCGSPVLSRRGKSASLCKTSTVFRFVFSSGRTHGFGLPFAGYFCLAFYRLFQYFLSDYFCAVFHHCGYGCQTVSFCGNGAGIGTLAQYLCGDTFPFRSAFVF